MDMSQIGPSIHIKGEVAAQEPLMIAGQVDGTVQLGGHELRVAASAHVTADVAAEKIVVDGEVHGKLTGAALIVVHETGKVEGELHAPIIGLADGSYVKGRVVTAERNRPPELKRPA
jgi:cytoskeletal protein CcmA (bactofilin family)